MRKIAVALLLAVAGCTTTPTPLAYTPSAAPAGPRVERPLIADVSVTDRRGESDPTYVGTIRGGYGNPLKRVNTTRPVADEVRTAFEAALRNRGLAGGPAAPYTLTVVVTKLDGDQYSRREGNATFDVALVRRASGTPVYQDHVETHLVRGSLVTFDQGIFASADDLRKVIEEALSQAVDQTLDKPGFAAALAR
jgi:uncharacterized lipoprotein YajG